MKIIRYPKAEEWATIAERPQLDHTQLTATVLQVLDDVRQRGDDAVKDYEQRFDHVRLTQLAVSPEEISKAKRLVTPELKAALRLAHKNIYQFHKAQQFKKVSVKTQPGVNCWQQSVPIERVGLYIPGGTAPLFSTVLMLATPAKIAGCKEIVLCTPWQC